MTAAAKSVGTRANSPKKRPAKEVNLLEALPKPAEVEQESKSPYPKGVRVFTYQPKDGSKPILLAMNGFELPDKTWHFDVAQMPILSQTWKWMDKAKIPKDIQRETQRLPDPEYFAMLDAWLGAMRALQGGPKGSVTSGK